MSERLETLESKKIRETMPEAEKRALDRVLRKTDRRALADIERRFGQHIPASRLERVRRQPMRFLNHQEYLEHLNKNHIEIGLTKRILGDTDEKNRVTVDRQHMLIPRTVAHERLHQLSDKLYGSMVGRRMNEGTTEYLAGKVRGDLHLADMGRSYPEEVEIVQMLSARVGDDTIARAYFRGELSYLKGILDSQLGENALADVCRLTKERRYAEAKEIIKGR